MPTSIIRLIASNLWLSLPLSNSSLRSVCLEKGKSLTAIKLHTTHCHIILQIWTTDLVVGFINLPFKFSGKNSPRRRFSYFSVAFVVERHSRKTNARFYFQLPLKPQGFNFPSEDPRWRRTAT